MAGLGGGDAFQRLSKSSVDVISAQLLSTKALHADDASALIMMATKSPLPFEHKQFLVDTINAKLISGSVPNVGPEHPQPKWQMHNLFSNYMAESDWKKLLEEPVQGSVEVNTYCLARRAAMMGLTKADEHTKAFVGIRVHAYLHFYISTGRLVGGGHVGR